MIFENNKGQSGRIITALPVLLFVSLIMVGFLVFSAIISLSSPEPIQVSSLYGSDNVLMQEVILNNGDKTLMLNLLVSMEKGDIDRFDEFEDVLERFIKDYEGYCFYYHSLSGTGLKQFYKTVIVESREKDEGYEIFVRDAQYQGREDILAKWAYSIDDKPVEAEFYFGECDVAWKGVKHFKFGNLEDENE